jgi:ABC-type multidrug transport system fused ATPase/permease subunit
LFLKNSKVLCFDETTANIDAESEELLIDTIYNSPLLSTALVISHSLKTTSQARRILVLDDGRLVGDGSHPQLSSTCPAYRRLYGEAVHVNETIGEAA